MTLPSSHPFLDEIFQEIDHEMFEMFVPPPPVNQDIIRY